jgi:crossover junction endodeoxyribonuclease RusA
MTKTRNDPLTTASPVLGHSGASTLLIEIPWTPDSRLSPNARVHYMRRADLVKVGREAAYYATMAALDLADAATVEALRSSSRINLAWSVRWGPRRQTTHDWRNLTAMLKCAEDGIADALGLNDRIFRDVAIEQERDESGVGVVLVTVQGVA